MNGNEYEQKFARYIVLGLVIGAVFGASLGPAIGNALLDMAGGAKRTLHWALGWALLSRTPPSFTPPSNIAAAFEDYTISILNSHLA